MAIVTLHILSGPRSFGELESALDEFIEACVHKGWEVGAVGISGPAQFPTPNKAS